MSHDDLPLSFWFVEATLWFGWRLPASLWVFGVRWSSGDALLTCALCVVAGRRVGHASSATLLHVEPTGHTLALHPLLAYVVLWHLSLFRLLLGYRMASSRPSPPGKRTPLPLLVLASSRRCTSSGLIVVGRRLYVLRGFWESLCYRHSL